MKSVRFQLAMLVMAGVLAAIVLTGMLWTGNYVADKKTLLVLDAKDVTADILPPPLYLIELRLVLAFAMDGSLTVDQAQSELLRLGKE